KKGKLDNSNMGDSDEKLKDDMKNNEHENLSAENVPSDENTINDKTKEGSTTLKTAMGYITKFKDFIQNKSENYMTTKDKNSEDKISDDKSSDDIKLDEKQNAGDQNDLYDNNKDKEETISIDDALEKGKLDKSNLSDNEEKLDVSNVKNSEDENLSAENVPSDENTINDKTKEGSTTLKTAMGYITKFKDFIKNKSENYMTTKDKNSDDKSSDDIKLNEEQTSGDQNDLYDNNKDKEETISIDDALEKGKLDKSNLSDNEEKLDVSNVKNSEDENLSAENVPSDENTINDKTKEG
ncbi:hypothetical protein PFDG_04924, partial [Plasmodium falciparum Dd2]